MIDQGLLDMLRCPLDPSNVRLEIEGESLACTRCRLRFPVRHEIPCMLVEFAELPPGCASIDDLPCQREKAASRTTAGEQS
jgi:uncharacterized protein YbaR (Trm112 family)